MKKLILTFVMVMTINSAHATQTIYGIGASLLSQTFSKKVTDAKTGALSSESGKEMLGGTYAGICDVLAAGMRQWSVKCAAVSGAISTDLNLPFGTVNIFTPGIMTQFKQLLNAYPTTKRKALIISLVNDGTDAFVPTMQVIDYAIAHGFKPADIIVQAYPSVTPDFQRSIDTSKLLDDPFWASVTAALTTVVSPTDWAALVAAQKQTLAGYRGTKFVDIYPGLIIKTGTIDGLHLTATTQFGAAKIVSQLLN